MEIGSFIIPETIILQQLYRGFTDLHTQRPSNPRKSNAHRNAVELAQQLNTLNRFLLHRFVSELIFQEIVYRSKP